MRISIGIPGISWCLEHCQVKPLVGSQSMTLKRQLNDLLVFLVLRSTCKVLELVANNAADAHDYLVAKLKPKQPV